MVSGVLLGLYSLKRVQDGPYFWRWVLPFFGGLVLFGYGFNLFLDSQEFCADGLIQRPQLSQDALRNRNELSGVVHDLVLVCLFSPQLEASNRFVSNVRRKLYPSNSLCGNRSQPKLCMVGTPVRIFVAEASDSPDGFNAEGFSKNIEGTLYVKTRVNRNAWKYNFSATHPSVYREAVDRICGWSENRLFLGGSEIWKERSVFGKGWRGSEVMDSHASLDGQSEPCFVCRGNWLQAKGGHACQRDLASSAEPWPLDGLHQFIDFRIKNGTTA
jgi:hypothetical protein